MKIEITKTIAFSLTVFAFSCLIIIVYILVLVRVTGQHSKHKKLYPSHDKASNFNKTHPLDYSVLIFLLASLYQSKGKC